MNIAPELQIYDAEVGDNVNSNLLRQLAEHLLEAATVNDIGNATITMQRLFDLRGKFPNWANLQEIALGKVPVSRDGVVYVLGEALLSPSLQQDFADAIKACAEYLDITPPVIVVDCAGQLSGMHLTTESFPGLAFIKLSNESSNFRDNLRYEVFHETAHCFLSCGVRFLDEGLACLFADRFSGKSYPVESQSKCTYDVQTLLTKAAGKGLFFEGANIPYAEAQAVRKLGAHLLGKIASHSSPKSLVRLFRDVEQAISDDEVIRCVEKHYGKPLNELNEVQKITGCVYEDTWRISIDTAFSAFERNSHHLLDSTITNLEEQRATSAQEVLDALIFCRIMQAMLQLECECRIAEDALSRIDILIAEAKSKNLSPSRLWALRGHRAVLAIKNEKASFVKLPMLSAKAMTAYKNAMRLDPEDPDPRIGYAHMLIHMPAKFGGNRAEGISIVREIVQHPLYGRYANAILLKIEAISAPRLSAASDGAICKTSKPNKVKLPAAIRVLGLIQKVSDSFTLNIPFLEVSVMEKVAFVGGNGAGKTVLLETMLGIRDATVGEIHFGISGRTQSFAQIDRKAIGGMLQNVGVFGDTYVRDLVRLRNAMYGKDDGSVSRALDIEDLLEKQYKDLSRGQEQRVLLFLALAHRPAIVFLDEPNLGLDEWYGRALRSLLLEMECAIVMASHVPEDLECMDRIICMMDGLVIDEGNIADLKLKYVGNYKAKVSADVDNDVIEKLNKLEGVKQPAVLTNGGWQLFGNENFAKEFRRFAAAEMISAFSIDTCGTEDFLAHITRS